MPLISALNIYPVKSLGGISMDSVELTDRGFQYDRRWMLVDANNQFLTQREHPQMALLQTAIAQNGIRVFQKSNPADEITIPFRTESNTRLLVNVWDDWCFAVEMSSVYSEWFSDALKLNCRLVHMPDNSLRKVDPQYAINDKNVTSFSDAYPVLLISNESLRDLNSRLDQPLPMNRFRPNLVIEGLEPYEEDIMKHFIINGIHFYGVKLCSRCVLTTVDQQTGIKGKEPLKTLATYRVLDNNIYFGQNIIYNGTGVINKGDAIKIIEKGERPEFRMLAVK